MLTTNIRKYGSDYKLAEAKMVYLDSFPPDLDRLEEAIRALARVEKILVKFEKDGTWLCVYATYSAERSPPYSFDRTIRYIVRIKGEGYEYQRQSYPGDSMERKTAEAIALGIVYDSDGQILPMRRRVVLNRWLDKKGKNTILLSGIETNPEIAALFVNADVRMKKFAKFRYGNPIAYWFVCVLCMFVSGAITLFLGIKYYLPHEVWNF